MRTKLYYEAVGDLWGLFPPPPPKKTPEKIKKRKEAGGWGGLKDVTTVHFVTRWKKIGLNLFRKVL